VAALARIFSSGKNSQAGPVARPVQLELKHGDHTEVAPPRTVRTDPGAANDRPGWYFGLQHRADGLGTTYFALPAPAAMGCLAVAVLRTRVLPRWTGYLFVAAMVLLIGPVRRIPLRSTATTPALTPPRPQAAARRPAPGNLHPVASPQRSPAREAAPELAVLCRSAPANSTKAHAQSRQGARNHLLRVGCPATLGLLGE